LVLARIGAAIEALLLAHAYAQDLPVTNPHTYVLGENGRFHADNKTEAKKSFDPKGLPNPGKLKNCPLPPGL
jgi:hypothetical protein